MKKEIQILLVDDHEGVRNGLKHMLAQEEDLEIAGQSAGGDETLSQVAKLSPDIVLMDIKMPGVDGIELTRQVKRQDPSCNVIMLTLYDEYLTQAMEAGARGYLLKDIKREELTQAIRQVHRGQIVTSSGIQSETQLDDEDRHSSAEDRRLLPKILSDVTTAINNTRLFQGIPSKGAELKKVQEGILHAMSLAMEMRDPYTNLHQQQVAELACKIATEMGLSEWDIDGIRITGLLHDVGKITVPVEILCKPGNISQHEFSIIKTHARVGYEMLKEIEFPWPISQVILQHHERLNGQGYPEGLAGKDITLEARILAVADVIEAMLSHRPYRPALGFDCVFKEISRKRGIWYDPEVVDACLRLFRESGMGN